MHEEKIELGRCYHSGLAYALGYDANGEIELDDKLFTNIDIGIDGGAMEALRNHRANFDASRDIKRFIVGLKLVKVIDILDCNTKNKNEENSLSTECDEECCGSCDENDDYFDDEDDLENVKCLGCDDYGCSECEGYYEDECQGCYESVTNCFCDVDSCDICGDETNLCACENKGLDTKFVCDSFKSMNAFERARWIRAQGKL